MGLNNYLVTTQVDADGNATELHIAFSYGEVREYEYRMGDRVYIKVSERNSTSLDKVVAGHAYLKGFDDTKYWPEAERFFRIVIINGMIASCVPTSRSDYDALEEQT